MSFRTRTGLQSQINFSEHNLATDSCTTNTKLKPRAIQFSTEVIIFLESNVQKTKLLQHITNINLSSKEDRMPEK